MRNNFILLTFSFLKILPTRYLLADRQSVCRWMTPAGGNSKQNQGGAAAFWV